MKRKVLRLSESFNSIKDVNLMLATNTSRELVEDPFKSMDRSRGGKLRALMVILVFSTQKMRQSLMLRHECLLFFQHATEFLARYRFLHPFLFSYS